jgi:hypothetical protein
LLSQSDLIWSGLVWCVCVSVRCVCCTQADVEAWADMQPPPKAKGKPTPEWLEASKVRRRDTSIVLSFCRSFVHSFVPLCFFPLRSAAAAWRAVASP